MPIPRVTYEVVTFPNGTSSLRVAGTPDVMHSMIGPWEEAQLLYVRQSELAERLTDSGQTGDLVIHDVGLGAAANSIAAVQCYLELASRGTFTRRLEIISYETDLDGIRTALQHISAFPFLIPHRQTLEYLLERTLVNIGPGIQWILKKGRYEDHLSVSPTPEVVFYDPYSPKSCPDSWSMSVFSKLHAKLSDSRQEGKQMEFYTYSASTSVRVALLEAGFYVGEGVRTSAKRETTVASTHLARLKNPLGTRWLDRLGRSHVLGSAPELRQSVFNRILHHPQFRA